MDENIFKTFLSLVSQRSGLFIPSQDQESFRKKTLERMGALGFSELEDYVRLIEKKSPEGELEWDELLAVLTNGESYFFRDLDQFSLLRNSLFPEIIDRQKHRRLLRLWSAGCSSGEEPYSLAIIVNELILDLDKWNILILGTDISKKAIERAKAGIFSPWSLRSMDPEMKNRYFSKSGDSWILDERIRQMVTFCRANLMEEDFPEGSAEFRSLDLIFCRNVFIYFQTRARSHVVKKFAQTLKDDGYLITGHGELLSENLETFKPRISGEQVFYQKNLAPSPQGSSPTGQAPTISRHTSESRYPGSLHMDSGFRRYDGGEICQNATVSKETSGQVHEITDTTSEIAEMRADLESGRFSAVVNKGQNLMKRAPRRYEVYILLAQGLSNSGDYDNAFSMCQIAMDLNPQSPDPPFLLAQLMETKGRLQEAKTFLKKAVYLAPNFVAAYLELGKLYAREKDGKNARKMYTAAMELLKDFPLESSIVPFRDISAGELVLHVEKLLREEPG